jgi:hypothetical protein
MPLDHYIPQTHLKKFYSPALGERMYAIRKTDLAAFTPNSKAVCAINDGSTNAYLREDRAVEEFLNTIEPNYNSALDKLLAGNIDRECIYTMAGFISYVITCSPGGMRTQAGPIKAVTETECSMLEAQGVFLPPPPELAGTSLTELLRSGAVKVEVDPKYPQAIGITAILGFTARLGNFKWEILHNDFTDSPFFTSDFPVAIETTNDLRVMNRIVPLAPNLALRIKPDITLDTSKADFSFANFGYSTRRVGHEELVQLNTLIVRCAEDMVFYRDDYPWVRPFIAKNRHYRIEPQTQKLTFPTGTTGILHLFTLRIVASTPLV